MSVFFYATHALHALGPAELLAWPRPTLTELREAAGGFCAMGWSALQDRKVILEVLIYIFVGFMLLLSSMMVVVVVVAVVVVAANSLGSLAVCASGNGFEGWVGHSCGNA